MKETRSGQKRDLILEAAQQHFGHYGLSKTTMVDIAKAAGMSKALLYYYFEDKESIFAAVVLKEQQLFTLQMEEMIQSEKSAAEMLRQYNIMRVELLKKLLTLGKFSFDSMIEFKPLLKTLIGKFRVKEIILVERILNRGVAKKEFKSIETKEYAELLIDTLKGLRQAVYGGNNADKITNTTYNKLKKKCTMLTDVFVSSIRR